MNFKDEYQKAFQDIKADENFKQNLAAQMNIEKKRKRKPSYVGVLAAAAVLVLVLGVGFMTGILRGTANRENVPQDGYVAQSSEEPKDDKDIDFDGEMLAGQDMSDSYVDMSFSSLSWYGEAETEEELLSVFVTLLCGDTLEKMYCTTEESFDESARMSQAETEAVLKELQNLSCTEKEFAGESKYYKAVFKDGLTVKFWISDEGCLKLQDTGAVFEIL